MALGQQACDYQLINISCLNSSVVRTLAWYAREHWHGMPEALGLSPIRDLTFSQSITFMVTSCLLTASSIFLCWEKVFL